jgi:hypothetical protein
MDDWGLRAKPVCTISIYSSAAGKFPERDGGVEIVTYIC